MIVSSKLERSLAKLWGMWGAVRERAAKEEGPGPEWETLAHFLWPEILLAENDKQLRNLPQGRAVLGLASQPFGELIAMAFWSGSQAKGERSLNLERSRLTLHLERLFRPAPTDHGPRRGDSSSRREAWAGLEEILAPMLSELVAPSGNRPPLAWSVLAPGALRSVPLLGMRVGGRLLAEQVKSVAHLPALGFGALPEARDRDFTLCLLAREHDAGSTVFGEAVIETLRRIHPPDVIADVHERPKGKIPEVDVLERHRDSIRTLRLYGVGRIVTLNDTLAAMALEGNQALRERNISETFLRGAVVELWAATAGMADVERVTHQAGDRIPGLAWGFLANGALAVIDLAWPVHDVVKALVCEQYGLLRRVKGHGAAVLAEAIAEVAGMLRMLPGLPASCSARDVLALLDKLRQTSARKQGFSAVVPFEAALESSGLEIMPGAELRDELTQPVHLAAFRWWGS